MNRCVSHCLDKQAVICYFKETLKNQESFRSMKKNKKNLLPLLCLAMIAGLLTGCGESAPAQAGEEKLSIVTTIFPEYDWVRQILGDKAEDVELTLLLGNGVDLHSYQPTADDMIKISTCDLFIHVGGESDDWVDDALAGAVNRDMVVVGLLDVLDDAVKQEELVEGMQADSGESETGLDEHVWLSLRSAAAACSHIAKRLGELDPENKAVYEANAAAYIEKLDALNSRYTSAVSEAKTDTLLFGDRFPFRYLTDDYGLKYYAAFAGCSAETEASFETIVFLSGKIEELGLPAILTPEGSDKKLAQTIVDNTSSKSARILQMDSLQSTTLQDIAGGKTYLGAMEQNLEVLCQALS